MLAAREGVQPKYQKKEGGTLTKINHANHTNHVNHINHMIMYDIFFFEISIKKEERRGPYKT